MVNSAKIGGEFSIYELARQDLHDIGDFSLNGMSFSSGCMYADLIQKMNTDLSQMLHSPTFLDADFACIPQVFHSFLMKLLRSKKKDTL